MKARVILPVVATAALLLACSSDSTEGDGGGATACASDTRKDVYTAGLAKQANGISVKILDAAPAPPAKGTNAMTLEVRDANDKALDGATVSVAPFMPDHGHGSAVVPVVTPGGDGKYAVSKLYLPMAGLWRVTVTVQPAGAPPQEIAFAFCLDG